MGYFKLWVMESMKELRIKAFLKLLKVREAKNVLYAGKSNEKWNENLHQLIDREVEKMLKESWKK